MFHSKDTNKYAAKQFAAKNHTKGRSLDAIWYLIVGSLVGVMGLTLLGWMDWTPAQANVPHTDDVFTQEEMQEAMDNGSLELHPY